MVPKSVTLNDLERRNNHSQVAAVHLFGLSRAIIVRDLLFDNRVITFIDELFVSEFVFYVVLFELMVKKLP